MKKSYLMIAVAAIAMVSCAQDDQLRNGVSQEKQEAISFASFSERATRGDVSKKDNLEFYHNTFSVYSKKQATVEDKKISSVFDNDIITYSSGDTQPNEWTYSPYRFWDKQANYEFIAVAPNANNIKYVVSENAMIASGNFEGSYTLTGVNLQATATTAEMIKGFTGTCKDIDIMTSDINPQKGWAHNDEVNMIFHHILAKLNVTIKKDKILDNAEVLIKKLEIRNFIPDGTYSENQYKPAASGSAAVSGWTPGSTKNLTLVYNNASGEVLNISSGDAKYFIESLVMPQTVASGDANDQTIVLEYEIVNYNASGDAIINQETFKYKMYTADAFTTFMDRNNYTINFTIKPDVIEFDATAVVWDENTTDITIE